MLKASGGKYLLIPSDWNVHSAFCDFLRDFLWSRLTFFFPGGMVCYNPIGFSLCVFADPVEVEIEISKGIVANVIVRCKCGESFRFTELKGELTEGEGTFFIPLRDLAGLDELAILKRLFPPAGLLKAGIEKAEGVTSERRFELTADGWHELQAEDS